MVSAWGAYGFSHEFRANCSVFSSSDHPNIPLDVLFLNIYTSDIQCI